MSDIATRLPPQNLEAEQSVLGAILLDNGVIGEAAEEVKPDAFYRDSHREIFSAMLALAEEREPIDAITIANELRSRQTLEAIGGPDYIAELAMVVPTAANVRYYARIVREMSQLRALSVTCAELSSEAYDIPGDVSEFLENAAGKVFAAAFEQRDRSAMLEMSAVLRRVLQRIEQAFDRKTPLGLTTGWTDLDRMVGGFEPGDYVLIAARPSMGKTAFAVDLARRFGLQGQPIAFFSLEMKDEQIGARMLCCESRVSYWKARGGFLRQDDFPKLAAAASTLSDARIFVDDSSASTPLSLRNRCRTLTQLLRGAPLGAIVVDYLQLMSPSGRTASEQEALTQISKAIKAIAKDFKCPIFALSQLNRDCEKREDKRPMLADLRASGALEQDADVILFLYRDDYYRGEKSQKPGVTEVIIAKQRNGPTGSVDLAFLKETMRFENYASSELAGGV